MWGLSVYPARKILPLLILGPLLAAGAAAPADPNRAWTALADNRPQDVLRQLRPDAPARADRLAWAAARIGAQPATDGSMREAEAVLAALEQGTDELAAEAAYLRARIYQLHLNEPDFQKAAQLYGELAQRQPGSHWAQLGLVKLGLLKLYLLPEVSGPGADRLAAAEALLPRIHEPLLRRDLHLQIGQAGIALSQPQARFLPHLIAAEQVGGITGNAQEDLVVQIGVLSERAGDWARAREYFEKYLAAYPTNVRAYTIRRKLADVNRRLAQEGRP
jgi:tetratricopeptide (TPR) repeat protein